MYNYRLAKTVCKYFYLPSDIAKPILSNLRLLKQIQLRLAAITCNLPHRNKHGKVLKPPCEPAPSLRDLILKSQHSFLDPDAGFLSCSVCLGRHSLASPGIRDFLAKECSPTAVFSTHLFRVSGSIFINGHSTHITCGCHAE